ncbi:MAG: hypothetical protein OEZ10_10115 [Gammaproteobacteria bacterium]|nr:hypothetical protein [Gammaproteobacteria bacterium]
MKKVLPVVFFMVFGTATFAAEKDRDDYEVAVQDGQIHALTESLDTRVRFSYKLLESLEKSKGKDVNAARAALIDNINSSLFTLGNIIQDIEEKRAISDKLIPYLKKENERGDRAFEKILGKEKHRDMHNKVVTRQKKFWSDLKAAREKNRWNEAYLDAKTREVMEPRVTVALEVLEKYGNIFRVE